MKKEYIKPTVKALVLEGTEMICVSGLTETLNTEEKAVSTDTPLSREGFSLWDDEE